MSLLASFRATGSAMRSIARLGAAPRRASGAPISASPVAPKRPGSPSTSEVTNSAETARSSDARSEEGALTRAIHISFPDQDGYRTFSFWDSFRIGRDASCELRLDDPRVSPRHLEVYRVGNVWWIRDLESEGGTFLDDEPIDTTPLRSAAALRLGEGGPKIFLFRSPPPGRSRRMSSKIQRRTHEREGKS